MKQTGLAHLITTSCEADLRMQNCHGARPALRARA